MQPHLEVFVLNFIFVLGCSFVVIVMFGACLVWWLDCRLLHVKNRDLEGYLGLLERVNLHAHASHTEAVKSS